MSIKRATAGPTEGSKYVPLIYKEKKELLTGEL